MRPKAVLTGMIVVLVAGPALCAEGIRIPDSILSRLSDQQRQSIQQTVTRQNQQRRKDEDKRRKEEIKKQTKLSLTLIKELYKKAEEAFKEENYASARNYYEDVSTASVKGAEKMAQTAKLRLAEIEKVAQQRLQEAELKIIQGDYAGAAEILASIISTFAYTDACKEADRKLRILRNTPKAAAAVLYADALAELNAENYPGAVKKFREIVAKYPGQVAALKARKRLEALEKDPAVQEALKVDKELLAEKLCPKWMNMANNYILNDQKGRAKEYLLRISDEFPGTSYAADAKKKLAEL